MRAHLGTRPVDAGERAELALVAFVAERDETTTDELIAHLRAEHRLAVSAMWISREMRQRGWAKSRQLHSPTIAWRRREPDVIDLADPAKPRRHYNAEEQAMIGQGRDAEAKSHWHERTGR